MLYWHKPDTFDAALSAAIKAKGGIEASMNAIEREIVAREFICDFDDPCDRWGS